MNSEYERGPTVCGEKCCVTNSRFRSCLCSNKAQGKPEECGGGKKRETNTKCHQEPTKGKYGEKTTTTAAPPVVWQKRIRRRRF